MHNAILCRLRLVCCVLILVAISAAPAAADFFERGERAFLQNNPEDAAALLEVAIQQQPARAQAYIYLGVAYIQLGYLERAAATLQRGISNAADRQDRLYHNLALVYQQLESFESALQAYGAAVQHNPGFSPAYLNRANLQVRQGAYQDALSDYRIYLNIAPDGPESGNVRRMIAALEDEIADLRAQEERERIAREEAERQAELDAEAQRIREEEERLAAERRRRELLGSVLESLEDIGQESDALGAESEEFEDFDFEIGREN